MNTASKIEPGSKMDKLVKLFVAMRAVSDLAPWGGGLNSDSALRAMHDELGGRFSDVALSCNMSEVQALKACNTIIDGE